MQQATGCSDVFPTDVSKEEILKTRTVSWEILPQGVSDREFVRISHRTLPCLARLKH